VWRGAAAAMRCALWISSDFIAGATLSGFLMAAILKCDFIFRRRPRTIHSKEEFERTSQ
jgi:hypothetical protein